MTKLFEVHLPNADSIEVEADRFIFSKEQEIYIFLIDVKGDEKLTVGIFGSEHVVGVTLESEE